MNGPAPRDGVEGEQDRAAVDAAEHWFRHHGLPYFIDDVRDRVASRLRTRSVVAVLLVGLVLGVGAGAVVVSLTDDGSLGPPVGVSVVIVVAMLWALLRLEASVIARWALRRAFQSLGLLVPLVTRALPMLLLFITFLFINTEVWQVASALEGGVLWGSVLFFAAAAVGFLVPRMADELDRFDDSIEHRHVVAAAIDTPLAQAAGELDPDDVDLPQEAQVTGLQMVNLVVVLVIAQAVQVLLLSLAVFAFFLVFGAVAIEDSVIASWLGHPPHYLPWGFDLISVELAHVAVFLAAFSGLYFTVVAITDDTYRREFFAEIMEQLERAVGARVVYRHLRRTSHQGDVV